MNWGKKIITGMLLFMAFIVTMVVMMFANFNNDDLIEKDYYEKGQSYDTDYNAKMNAQDDRVIPVVGIRREGVDIRFPVAVSYDILFRRLSNSDLDTRYNSEGEIREVLIPASDLTPGPWLLTIRYQKDSREYLYEDKITLP